MTPTPHLTTLREIEQEEDAAQAMQIRGERLRQLREIHRVALRRQGLGALLDARPGDRFGGCVAVEARDGGVWWLMESD